MSETSPATGETRLARNTWTAYALRFSLGLSVLLLTPYLFRSLGVGGFGTWSVIFTVASVFDLLEVGFSAGVIKVVAELRARRDSAGLGETIGAGALLLGPLGLLAASICVAIALFGDGLASAGEVEDFRLGMFVLAGAIVLRFAGASYGAALIGHQRYDLYNLTRLATTTGFSVAAVVAVEAGGGVLGVAVAYAASLALDGLVFAVLLRRLDPEISLAPRRGEPELRRRVLSLSSFGLLAESMNYVGQRMDTVVIAALRGAIAAAPFAAALKLQSGLQSLSLPFVNPLMPLVSELWGAERRSAVVDRFLITTRLALQITLPVAVALALFADDLVGLWLGADAPAVTASIVVLLMIVQTITLTATPAERVLVGIGRVRGIAMLVTAEGLSNIALSIILVSRYGAIGAALGTLFTTALLAPLRLPLACRALDIAPMLVIRRGIGPALLASAPAVAAMLIARFLLPAGDLRLAAGIAAGIGLAAAVGIAQLGTTRLRAAVKSTLGRSGVEPVTESTG